MLEREATIINRQGMHARPAMQIVETANRFASKIKIRKGAMIVDAKSIMQVMTLEAVQGTVLVFQGEGADAAQALEALAQVVADKFHED